MKWSPLNKTLRKKRGRFQPLSDRLPDQLKTHKQRVQTISSILPNAATVLALCAGLSSVRFALELKWELAVTCIILASILDATDGKLARMLGSTSRFGAELDSLADFISFGVSPALVLYLKTLNQLGGFGWIITLFFSVCMGLRLARFNTLSIEGSQPQWSQGFFMGVPAPAAALLGLTPLMCSFVSKNSTVSDFVLNPYLNGIIFFIVACLMVSQTPTFSIKKLSISPQYILPVTLLLVLITGAIYVEPWLVLSFLSFLYISLIPFSIRAFKRAKKNHDLSVASLENKES